MTPYLSFAGLVLSLSRYTPGIPASAVAWTTFATLLTTGRQTQRSSI